METETLSGPAKVLAFCATILVFSFCIARAPVWAQEGLAMRYENSAQELMVKIGEQKQRLQHYEDKDYIYGRQGQDSRSNTLALLREYEWAAEKATAQAAFHNRLASKSAKRNYGSRSNIASAK